MRALVLMKAMPPTRGHQRLIEFAKSFAESGVVFMDTAPGEPLNHERYSWIENRLVLTDWRCEWRVMDDQDPASEGFWGRWKKMLGELGHFDLVIGSEPYCAKVAEVIGARYVPYDPDRKIEWIHATSIRERPLLNFAQVAPDFQSYMRLTTTIFGAESTGKSTLAKKIQTRCYAEVEWTPEYARPYLETVGTEVTVQAMNDIWHGQFAIEQNAEEFAVDKPHIVRDTDLYSTIGYWELYEDELGPVPKRLIEDALFNKADLYLITPSNIPFEKDALRYGGDHRESPDQFWIDLCEKYELPYKVLTSNVKYDRLVEAAELMREAFDRKNQKLTDAVRV